MNRAHVPSETDRNQAIIVELSAQRLRGRDLVEGATEFFDLPEPVLGFRRGAGTVCVFNLSPKAVETRVTGGTILLAQAAEPGKNGLTLGPNGFAILDGGAVA